MDGTSAQCALGVNSTFPCGKAKEFERDSLSLSARGHSPAPLIIYLHSRLVSWIFVIWGEEESCALRPVLPAEPRLPWISFPRPGWFCAQLTKGLFLHRE